MEQREYQAGIKEIERCYASVADRRKTMTSIFNDAAAALQNYFGTEAKSWKSFLDYSKNLEKISYSGDVTGASDVFPGIRTVDLENTIEDMVQIQEEMRQQADDYDTSTDELARLQHTAETNLKQLYDLLKDYFEGSNEVVDKEHDLLKDLDSVYDIRYLKK